MYVKIYFNDKPLFLCDELNQEINVYAHHDDAVFIDEFSTPAIKSMIHEMRQENVHAGIYYHNDLEKLKKAFWKQFSIVLAAGGLVLNEKKQVLMIFRRGKWDLPKGKLDKGEKLEDCALREVKEETGLHHVKLEDKITVTYHTYNEFGKHILKESHWYGMTGHSADPLTPQTEEDIHEIVWVEPKALEEKMKNSYPSVVEVIKTTGILP
jgi:8-oxo-dGTP pyrophosphatase MutT (NUDIX family)